MSRLLDSLERLMEEAVEGTVQRLFRPRLQPIRLAKVAVRRMEAQQVVGPSGLEVPNSFSVGLHPQDYSQVAPYRSTLERELEKYLQRYAQGRGWRPVGPLMVKLHLEERAAKGRPQVTAQMLDPVQAPRMSGTPDPEKLAIVDEPTLVRPRLGRPLDLQGLEPRQARLCGQDGAEFVVRGPVVSLGRALDNDVVLTDSRVSRYHAELRPELDHWELRDLGSTNGTFLGDVRVDRQELSEGDSFSLGGYQLTLRSIRPNADLRGTPS